LSSGINLRKSVELGESENLEFKTSSASLSKSGTTLCGFLNGNGGQVLIGVNSKAEIVGQHVSDRTLQEVSEIFRKFEPPALLTMTQVTVKNGKSVIVISAFPRKFDVPFVFDGRPYQRIGSTTSIMPQHVYQRLLLERNHQNHGWETAQAPSYSLDDLDSEEILRTIRLGIEAGRLPEQRDDRILTMLDCLGLIKEDTLSTQLSCCLGTDCCQTICNANSDWPASEARTNQNLLTTDSCMVISFVCLNRQCSF
jgi:ATP-dependent DNA helicase RecG